MRVGPGGRAVALALVSVGVLSLGVAAATAEADVGHFGSVSPWPAAPGDEITIRPESWSCLDASSVRIRFEPEFEGATDPAEAAPGTIRKLYAESKGRNAIHASDSQENAVREVGFFFSEGELAGLWR